MGVAVRRVFRPIAIRRYVQRKQQPQFPALIRPRGFALLWITVALALAGLGFVLTAELPRTATGQAMILESVEAGEADVVVLLPAHELRPLAPGQTVLLDSGAAQPLRAETTRIEQEALSPGELRQRWPALASSDAAHGPAAVAFARCTRPCDQELLAGALLKARVMVAKESLWARLTPQATREGKP